MNTKIFCRSDTLRFLLLWIIALISSSSFAETFLLKDGNVVDVIGGRVMETTSLLVKDGKIVELGRDLKVPADAKILDFNGKFIMPGLIDAHSHVAASGLLVPNQAPGSLLLQTYPRPTAYRAIRGVANLRSLLDSGFTTIRDLGLSGNYGDIALLKGINEGWIAGPHMVTSGIIIGPLGAHANAGLNPEKMDLPENDHIVTFNADGIRRGVQENIQHGAGVIKLVVEHQRLLYTTDQIKAAVDEAARAGILVAAHAFTDKAMRNSVQAGVATIEHGVFVSDKTLRMMESENVILVDTTFPQGTLDIVTAARYRIWLERLKRAYKIGVKIAFGSDVFWHVPGKTRGELSLANLKSYVDAGISNAEILRFITINAADAIGVGAETGSLEVGKRADVIVVNENPFEDINVLYDVSFVMKSGIVNKHEGKFSFIPKGFDT